jgi:Tfp pilus assembly protein PilN
MKQRKRINFLDQDKQKKGSRSFDSVKLVSGILLGVYLLVGLGVFGFYIYKKRENNNLQTKISRAKNRIKQQSSVETKQRYLVSKVQNLSLLLDSKEEHRLLIETLLTLLPDGVSVSKFEIGSQDEINFNAESKDFRKVEEFLTRIKNNQELLEMKVTNAVIESFRFTEKNYYSMGIKLSFAPKEENNAD